MNLWLLRGKWESGTLEGYVHSAIFKMDNKTYHIAHGTLLNVMCQPGWEGVWRTMDTCICMAEPFCHSPDITTKLLIVYTPPKKCLKFWGEISRRKKKKKKKKKHCSCIDLHSHQQWVSLFTTSSSTFVICGLLADSHSDRCEAICHHGVNLCFPDEWWCWSSFHVSVGHLHNLFEKIPIQVFCSFLNQVVFVFYFSDIEFFELCIFGSLVSYIICKYFISTSRLSFHFVNGFLCCAKNIWG